TTWLCRNASSLFPALGPKHHHARAEFVSVGRLTTRRTSLDRFDYSGTQVVGIRPWHRWSPRTESMPPDSLIDRPLGIPRFHPTEICSSCGRNVAFDNLCVIENELQAAMTNPLLRGLVDLLRPSVHGLASSLRLVAP